MPLPSLLGYIGEDLDIVSGNAPPLITAGSGTNFSSYNRCAFNLQGWGVAGSTVALSKTFEGGGVTSLWLSGIVRTPSAFGLGRFLGVGKASTLVRGIYIGSKATQKVTLNTYDGTTWVELAAEVGASWPTNATTKVDMQITDYGGSTVVNIYIGGSTTPIITYSSSISISGVADLDCIMIVAPGNYVAYLSEMFVFNGDTRAIKMVTQAPSGAAGTNNWNGTNADVDDVTLSDSDLIYINTNDQDFQCDLGDTPAGNYAVLSVAISARMCRTADSTPTKAALGVYTNSTLNPGSDQALTTGWDLYRRIMNANPVTSSIWNTAELDALLPNLRSKA